MAENVRKKTTERRITNRAPRVPKASKKTQGKRQTSKPRVLIADDDKPFRESLAARFASEKFAVTCATSIEDSIEAACKRAYDVVILDMWMPEKLGEGRTASEAGLIVARLLKRYAAMKKDVIVVIFTGYPSVRDCFATVDAGAYYLPKFCTYAEEDVIDMAGQLAAECRRLVEKRREHNHSRVWLVQHYTELVEKFSGKAIAVLQADADTGQLKTSQIGDRKVVAASTAEKLKAKILRNPLLRKAMPLVLDIWEENS